MRNDADAFIPAKFAIASANRTGIVPRVANGESVELPAFNGRGTATTDPALLPKAWYEHAQTFDWNRGEEMSWTLLARSADFSVFNPKNRQTRAVLRMRFSAVGSRVRVRVFVNGRDAGAAIVRGAPLALQMPAQPSHFAQFVRYPLPLTVRLALKPGVNRVTFMLTGSQGISTQRIAERSIGKPIVALAGILGSPVFLVSGIGSEKMSAALPAPAVRRSRGSYVFVVGKRLGAITIPLSTSLAGDPHLVGRIVRSGKNARAWLLVWTASRLRTGLVRSHIVPLPPGAFDYSIAQHLANSFDDSGARIAGASLVLEDGRFIATGVGITRLTLANGSNAPPKRFPTVCLKTRRESPVALQADACAATPPFILVFGESYHPEWSASLDGRTLTHVQVNGFENGWLVPSLRSGQRISLAFLAQRRFDRACAISIAGAVLCLLVLFFRRRRIVVCA